MKNKIISLIILLFIFCGFSTICKAVEAGIVSIDSNQNIVEKDDVIEITVNLKNNKIAACNFSLYFNEDKWEYVSKIENTNLEKNHILYVWHDINGGRSAKQGEIVKFKFKAKENGISTFSIDGDFYTSTGQKIKTEFEEKQVQIGKDETILQRQNEEEKGENLEKGNSYLQVLRLDKEGMSPAFDKEILEYYLNVSSEVKEIEVLAISENEKAEIEITGNKSLKNGLNTIKVQVTSEDKKEKRVYIIQVTKTNNLNLANSNLEILAIENTLLNPPFDANETNYSIEVANDVKNLNIFAVPENENAKVQISGANDIKEGNNKAVVTVTAANGFSKKKYYINIYKRSEQEQIRYDEEQREQKQKLEEAYEIEKVNSNEENKIENEKNGNDKIVIGSIIFIAFILILGVTVYFKRNKIDDNKN